MQSRRPTGEARAWPLTSPCSRQNRPRAPQAARPHPASSSFVCAGPAWGSPAALLARAELPGGRGRLRQAPQRTHGCRRLGSAHRGRSRLRTGNGSAHPCAPARRPLCDTCPRPMRPTALGVWHLLCGAQCREQTARPVRRCARLHTLAARPVGGPGSACSRKRHPPPGPTRARSTVPPSKAECWPSPRPGTPPSERAPRTATEREERAGGQPSEGRRKAEPRTQDAGGRGAQRETALRDPCTPSVRNREGAIIYA